MKSLAVLSAAAIFAAALPVLSPPARGAELANIKVVTDANPDYSDMESMVRSITSNWSSDEEKMYALFYWDHIARRQTAPMWLHGYEVTDPIRQYNDYGFTMCSTISGIKCSEWNYMGYPCRFWEIGLHTVPDVWYEGKFHHYDNSLSAMYTLPDGHTIAAVDDIGKTLAGPETNGQPVIGYIAMYHCLNGTGPDSFLQGADTERTLQHLGQGSFRPNHLHYQLQYYGQDRGYRYILNLRDGESYTRYYSRQDANTPGAVNLGDKNNKEYKADPAYYIPNRGEKGEGPGKDPELVNVRYHIRGNGERTWTPLLDEDHYAQEVYSTSNIKVPLGNPYLEPMDDSKRAEVVFKVEGANVITSLKIHADFSGGSKIAISTDNGLQWKEVGQTQGATGNATSTADIKLVDEVNGSYEVLVKVILPGDHEKGSVGSTSLLDISFDTITEINNHTQPTLHLGKNTVYVGNGDQSESIVFWPDLEKEHYKLYAFDSQNVKSAGTRLGQDDPAKPSSITFRMDAPADLTSITYGGRLYNSGKNSHIDFLHSFDNGKTWTQDYSLTDNHAPWDVIHYETLTAIPPNTKSVLLKYALAGSSPPLPPKVGEHPEDPGTCSLWAIHMEADHKLPSAPGTIGGQPLEVTFTWQERQKDFSLVQRSHTQLVDKLPTTYTLNVGGEDQPIVDSLAIKLADKSDNLKPGYSDGNENAGAEKYVGYWATYGQDLARDKKYTFSATPLDKKAAWGAEDPDMKKLTDGRVGSSYTGGINMREGVMWRSPNNLDITLDLGEPQKCAAFRIHTLGYEWWDSLKNESKDQIEVLTSVDGAQYISQGFFKTNLRRIDLPVNFMLPDDETYCAPNLFLAPPGGGPVEARYVKYRINSPRMFEVSEVQVLDGFDFKPFDLRIALPDPAANGHAAPKPDISPNAKQWKPEELPKTIGKPWKATEGSGE